MASNSSSGRRQDRRNVWVRRRANAAWRWLMARQSANARPHGAPGRTGNAQRNALAAHSPVLLCRQISRRRAPPPTGSQTQRSHRAAQPGGSAVSAVASLCKANAKPHYAGLPPLPQARDAWREGRRREGGRDQWRTNFRVKLSKADSTLVRQLQRWVRCEGARRRAHNHEVRRWRAFTKPPCRRQRPATPSTAVLASPH